MVLHLMLLLGMRHAPCSLPVQGDSLSAVQGLGRADELFRSRPGEGSIV